MGYGIYPDMTSEEVVCQGECEHIDCKELKKRYLNAKCHLCGKVMVGGDTFFEDSKKGVSHAACEYDEVERKRKAQEALKKAKKSFDQDWKKLME